MISGTLFDDVTSNLSVFSSKPVSSLENLLSVDISNQTSSYQSHDLKNGLKIKVD